jgi:CubicO group peptidase (beta-lactamase class C family)
VFKIGSVSKQFLATGIMLLVQDGKMALNDKISKYFEGSPPAWEAITVRHLLTHTSGLVREAPGFNQYRVQTDLDVIKTAYAVPLQFATGEKYQYSNLGYFALADIIRKVSGKPWPEFLTERVFTPLGMTATRVTTVADLVPKRADGYAWTRDRFQNTENWPAVRPSGAFLSTAPDLAKWEAALLTDRILNASIKTEMWTPVTLNDGQKFAYGLGWALDDFRGVEMIQHSGSLTGFRANYLRLPGHGLAVVALANLATADVNALAAGIAVRYVPELNLSGLSPRTDPDPERNRLVKTLLTNWAGGTKELPQATTQFGSMLGQAPPSVREGVAARLKEGRQLEYLVHKDVSGKRLTRLGVPVTTISHYRLTSSEGPVYYTFYTTADRRVAFMEPSSY